MAFPIEPDARHATPEATELALSYFHAKSDQRLEDTLGFFRPDARYLDATLNWCLPDLDTIRATLTAAMPSWAGGMSYPTRILGDSRSGIVADTATPELFGHEIRALSTYVAVDGVFARFVDYWDSRHFGVDSAARMGVPDDRFFAQLIEDDTAPSGSPEMRSVVEQLTGALAEGDGTRVADSFAADAALEDWTLRCQLVGRVSIARFVDAASRSLPWTGDLRIVRVLGDRSGGGFEWMSGTRPVVAGAIALELDDAGLITRFTAIWDGGRVSDESLTTMARHALAL